MRIDVVVPISTDAWNEGIRRVCQEAADTGTQVRVTSLAHGPESIESMYDEATAAPHIVAAVQQAERDGAAAVVVYCFGNPAVEAAREAVTVPVIGLGDAGELMAMALGDRFGVISTIPEAVPRLYRKARALGADARLAAVVPLGVKVADLGDPERLWAAALAAGRALLERGSQVIVLGCGLMLGMAERLRDTLGVPVVVPAVAAVKLAEAAVRMGASHSRLAYPRPPEKVRR